jgi:hypothetical protein
VNASVQGSELVLHQQHYQSKSNTLWAIPIVVSQVGPATVNVTTERLVWLEGEQLRVPISAANGNWPMVKPCGTGMFRVDWGEQWPTVVSKLEQQNTVDDVRGIADVIQDAFGLLADRRIEEPAIPLSLVRASVGQVRRHGGYALYATWLRELGTLAVMLQEEAPACVGDFHDFVMRLVMNATDGDMGIGTDERRRDTATDKLIRPLLLGAQIDSGCPVAAAALCPRVRQALWRPHEVNNDMRAQLFQAGIRGDCTAWGVNASFAFTALTSLYRQVVDIQLRHEILYVLPSAKDPLILQKSLDFARTARPASCPTSPTRTSTDCRDEFLSVYGVVCRNPAGGARAAWEWLKRATVTVSGSRPDRRLFATVAAYTFSPHVFVDMQVSQSALRAGTIYLR